ncbi:MAG: DUF1735 domain-containing protein [Bacteroidetes bacterium]|nr:DUF1735 domain-containing protein [Bacteroidota bacterium]
MFNVKYLLALPAAAMVLFSCRKSDDANIQGDPEVKFFIRNTGAGNLPDNSISYTAVNYPDAAGSGLINLSNTLPSSIKFPVYATQAVTGDVTVEAVLDNSLIAAYNTAHNTSYAALPSGLLNTGGLLAHIAKGASTSSDSITINTNVTGINTLTQTAYMAPIKLTTVSNPSVGKVTANSTIQVTYIIVSVEQRRIKYLGTTTDIAGALVSNRTAWAVSFVNAPTTTGSVTDGSTTTYSRWTASPQQVDVNLQATTNLTALRLYTSNSSTYIPTQVDVLVSNDGLTYDYVGSPLKANLTYASSYNYIVFYKAIPAKYVRLKLYYSTSTNTQNFRLTEFDVYAN